MRGVTRNISESGIQVEYLNFRKKATVLGERLHYLGAAYARRADPLRRWPAVWHSKRRERSEVLA